jgi:hypothetical protein
MYRFNSNANWPPAPRRYSPQPAEFIRPRSRAVQRLALAEFRVRPLGSLGLVVAPPACELGQDTFVTLRPRLDLCAPGRPSLLAMRWPGATGLTSYLSGCLSLTSQRCVLAHRRRSGSSSSRASARFLPGPGRSLSRADIGRLCLGCRLPDAILHGQRSFRRAAS